MARELIVDELVANRTTPMTIQLAMKSGSEPDVGAGWPYAVVAVPRRTSRSPISKCFGAWQAETNRWHADWAALSRLSERQIGLAGCAVGDAHIDSPCCTRVIAAPPRLPLREVSSLVSPPRPRRRGDYLQRSCNDISVKGPSCDRHRMPSDGMTRTPRGYPPRTRRCEILMVG